MKRIFYILSFACFIAGSSLSLYAQRQSVPKAPAVPGVAVMNFTNNSGNKNLQHLSTSLPETISTALTQAEGIRVVERENIGKLLNEIELQQTGMFDEADMTKVGKFSKADVLIIGSIAGTEQNIVVTMKAVEVASGKVLDGRVVQASIDRIFDITGLSARSMAALISGKSVGYISVSTNPDNCDIYLDGIAIGKSPVVSYRVSSGKHTILAMKTDYIDADTTITVANDAQKKWEPTLASKALLNRSEMGVSFHWYVPLSKDIQSGFLGSVYYGKTYEHIYIGGAVNYSMLPNNQKIDTVFESSPIEKERRLIMSTLSGHLNITPFTSMRYFSPYGGIFGGLGFLFASYKYNNEWANEKNGAKQFIYYVGALAGINMLPYSKISLFAEGRFYYYPADITRYTFESQGLKGGLLYKKDTANLTGFSIGAGFKYYFD